MVSLIKNFKWLDLIDILLITFIAYQLYSLFRHTKAFRILIGLMGLGVIYTLVKSCGLFLSTWVFQVFWQVLIVLIIIIFQPEIREVLERVNPLNLIPEKKGLAHDPSMVEAVCQAVFRMAEERTGAIIVFQQKDDLRNLILDGIPLDGEINEPILLSIFQKHSPIHDGAILIDGNKIKLVSGFLPMTEKDNLPTRYGSRHRASLGLSEHSDAFIVVVSEERGHVSAVQHGQIKRVPDAKTLSSLIVEHLSQKKKKEKLSLQEIISRTVMDNWPKKMAAFISIFLFWALLAGQQNYSLDLIVPIEYKNIPVNLELTSPPTKAKIFIKGTRKLVASLKPEDLRVDLNVSLAQWGRRTFYLSKEDISLPAGIQLEYIDPAAVRLDFRAKPSLEGRHHNDENE
ncbi:MAG: diadenylate cyclase [bacterium]